MPSLAKRCQMEPASTEKDADESEGGESVSLSREFLETHPQNHYDGGKGD
jgi:hypothetical protein